MSEHVRAYVTITHGLRGYFAVMVVNGDAWQTGIGSYLTREEAEPEAREWAKDEEVEFRS